MSGNGKPKTNAAGGVLTGKSGLLSRLGGFTLPSGLFSSNASPAPRTQKTARVIPVRFRMCLLARASSGPLFPEAAIAREGQRRACQQQDPEEMVQSRAGTAGLRELCSGLIYDCD